jgi:hypothetical protein
MTFINGKQRLVSQLDGVDSKEKMEEDTDNAQCKVER